MPLPKKAERDATRAQLANYTGQGSNYRTVAAGAPAPAPAGAAKPRAKHMLDSKIPYDMPGIINYLAMKHGYVDIDVFEGLETDDKGVPMLEPFPLDPAPAMEEILDDVYDKYGGADDGGGGQDSDFEDAGAGSGPPRPKRDMQAEAGEYSGGGDKQQQAKRGTSARKAERHEEAIYMPPDSTIVNFGMRRLGKSQLTRYMCYMVRGAPSSGGVPSALPFSCATSGRSSSSFAASPSARFWMSRWKLASVW